MATTTLSVASNRITSGSHLVGNSTTVPVDAAVLEHFILPVGYGQLLIEAMKVVVFALSGAYVAPTPAYDGVDVTILSSDALSGQDIGMSGRFVHYTDASARPQLGVYQEFFRPVLMRQAERCTVQIPIIAGAGVTATVQLQLRGKRIMTA